MRGLEVDNQRKRCLTFRRVKVGKARKLEIMKNDKLMHDYDEGKLTLYKRYGELYR